MIFSQNLRIFEKSTDNDTANYILKTEKHYADTSSVKSFLTNYLSKKISQSYMECGFDSIVNSGQNTDAYLTLGKKYENVEIDYSDSPFRVGKNRGKRLSNYPKITAQIVEFYTNRGFLFASVNLDSVNIDDDVFKAKLNISRNEQIRIDSLIINGEAKISRTYVERALELRKNSVLTTKKIDKIDSRIKNIPFLEQDRGFQLAFSGDKSDVLLFLKPKKSSAFSGVLGVMPKSQTTGKLMITGDIDLSLVNVLHRGESFKFVWKKYETQNQNLTINAAVPFVFKSPFGIGADFALEKKDSSYIKTDFYGKILIDNSIERGFIIYYRNLSSFPVGDTSENMSSLYSQCKTNLVGFGLKYCMVDNLLNPYKGFTLSLTADAGKKTEQQNSDTENLFYSTLQYDICGYIGLVDNLTLKLRNCSYYAYSEKLYDNEMIYVGGLQTIRGVDELSLPASYYSLASCELRYLFEKNSAVYVLGDYMLFGKKYSANNADNYAVGLGVGVDLNTAAGIFTLVYAVGKQNDNNFSFNNSKIHFGYKSYF